MIVRLKKAPDEEAAPEYDVTGGVRSEDATHVRYAMPDGRVLTFTKESIEA